MPAGGVRFTCVGAPIYMEGEYLGSKGCGYNLTELIMSQPKDGVIRDLQCPACSNTFIAMRPETVEN